MAAKKKTASKKSTIAVAKPVEKRVEVSVDPQALIETAIKQGSSIEAMERLLDLRDRLRKEQAEIEFRNAMSGFQSEMPVVEHNKKVYNRHGVYRYSYSELSHIVKTAQPYIGKYDLSYDIITETTPEPAGIRATTRVFHSMGHTEKSWFWVPIDPEAYMTDQQKWASAGTYAKRQAFCNAFGILTGDEDNDAGELPPVKPVDNKTKEDPAIEKKLKELPEYISQGFRAMGYTRKAVIAYCGRYNWDHKRIKRELDIIANAKDAEIIKDA